MKLLTIIVIAVGLAMDAFAAAIVEGSAYRKLHVLHAFRVAAFFGVFQALMPIAGYFCGVQVRGFIAGYDHWAAFALLSVIGGKMLYESTKMKPRANDGQGSSVVVLLALSVATSIDALVVGVTLGLVTGAILTAAVIIGGVTFVLSYAGVYIGQKAGHFFESGIEAAGGLVLIAIGVRILLGHMYG